MLNTAVSTYSEGYSFPNRPSKLDPFTGKLTAWFRIEASKSRKQQRRTARQMHADLVSLGYGGFYNRVAAFERAWKEARLREIQASGSGTFVPLVFSLERISS